MQNETFENLELEAFSPDAEFSEIQKENPKISSFIMPDSKARILDQISAYKERFSSLTISDVKDAFGFDLVSQARKTMQKARLIIEEIHKEGKAESRRVGLEWDAAKNLLLEKTEPIEKDLKAKEDKHKADLKALSDAKQKIINDLVAARLALLVAVDAPTAIHPLELPGMSNSDFNAHLAVATMVYNAKKEAERAQIARLAELEAQEVTRKAEEARKAQEQAEANRVEALRLEGIAKTQREAQAKLWQEQQEFENEKREVEESKIRAAELEKVRVETEAKVKREIDEKIQMEASEKLEQEEAKRKAEILKASQAGDKEKLNLFLKNIRMVQVPHINDSKLQGVLIDFTNSISNLDRALQAIK